MGGRGKYWIAPAMVAALVAILALVGPRPAGHVLGESTTVRVVSPGTAPVGATVAVEIRVENVANLGAYEWTLAYDPNVLELAGNPVDGGFLGSTGRSLFCPPAILDVGTVRFGCGTSGDLTLARPSGSGPLSTVTFKAIAAGSTSLSLNLAVLANSNGDDIPTGVVNASITVGGGTPPATPTPGGPSPTPGGPSPTPVGPTATPTGPTATPTGPTPTPAPTPPPEQSDWVELAAICNPVASTYPDGTTVQTLAAAISPPDILKAMWALEGGLWLGYSPLYPEASNLATRDFLDVVFLCVDAVGTFVRPLV
jgi:hypothetical protein